jgi:hypothetical protein
MQVTLRLNASQINIYPDFHIFIKLPIIYKKVESIKLKNDLIALKTDSLHLDILKQSFIWQHPYKTINKSDAFIHKKMSILLNNKSQFFLKTNKYVEEFIQPGVSTIASSDS